MKAKTRILAMLLTFLMVVGILPLSLFALDGPYSAGSNAQAQYEERTLTEIQTEFEKEGLDLKMFHSFEKWNTFDEGSTTTYTFPKGAADSAAASGVYADFTSNGTDCIRLSNFRQSYSVVTESDGNKALYFGYSDTNDNSKYNYIDLMHGLSDTFSNQKGDAVHDLFISMDMKMGGKNVSEAALISFVYRPGGSAKAKTVVYLSAVGGLYTSDNYSPENLLGYLSEDEYTRIAVATDRLKNKYYVYLNDVLVTPDGIALFNSNEVNEMNDANDAATMNRDVYTVKTIPIYEIRLYQTQINTNRTGHKGMYFDNFLIGARLPFTNTVTAAKGAVMNASDRGADGGSQFRAYMLNKNGLSFWDSNSLWSDNSPSLRFVDEDGDGKGDAIEVRQPAGQTAGKSVTIANNGDTLFEKGTNFTASIAVKAGSTGPKNYDYYKLIRTIGKAGTAEIYVQLLRDGTVKAQVYSGGTVTLGKINSDTYTYIKVDVVTNTLLPTAIFYIGTEDSGGKVNYELKATMSFGINFSDAITGKSDGYSSTDYHLSRIDFIGVDAATNALSEQDLLIKSYSYITTSAYDDYGTDRIDVFENKPEGLHEVSGITRYYNGDSTFKKKSFEADGENYIVGFNGSATKESDGLVFTPYAPYVDYVHTGTENFFVASADGTVLYTASGATSAYFGIDRDSITKPVKIGGNDAVLYTSFYDDADAGADTNSWSQIALPTEYQKDADVVLELDLMLDERLSEVQATEVQLFDIIGKINGDSGNKYFSLLRLDKEGWVYDYNNSTVKLFKLSKNEFTRLSVVIHTPKTGSSEKMTADVYANGVLVSTFTSGYDMTHIETIKYLSFKNADSSVFVKDIYMYLSAKPQQFYTMVGGEIALTSDQTLTAVKTSDIRQGFVSENGVMRYYDKGLPVAARNGFVTFADEGGKNYMANENGVVHTVSSDDASVSTDAEYTVSFNGVQDGSFGYGVLGNKANAQEIFAVTFNNLYFTQNDYEFIRLNIYLPETNKPTSAFKIYLGETQRFYKVTWLEENNYKFGDGTYFVDNAVLPEGAEVASAAEVAFTVENGRGGEIDVVYYDTDDVVGKSYGDTFYVRTANVTEAMSGSLAELSAGWNTLEIPVVDNGKYDIDWLGLISDTAANSSYITGVKVDSIKLLKVVRLVINAGVEDGISADGYYYKNGVAQVGWIDENNSGAEPDAGDYYATPNTAKLVTGIYSVNGVWYKFDTDGKLIGKTNGIERVLNGFNKLGDAIYSYKMFENGVIKSGLVEAGEKDGEKVYLYTDANGVSVQNGRFEDPNTGAVYSFDIDGYGKVICADANAHDYGEYVVTKLATCKTEGEEKSTCKKCGKEKTRKTELNPNIHETHVKGIATCCENGVKADGVTSVYGYSISLGKSVNVIFYLDVTGTEGEIEIGRRSAFIGETTVKTPITELEQVTVGEKTYRKVAISVAPNATDSVVKIRYVRADGHYGSSYEYKIEDYIKYVAGLSTPDEVFTEEVINLVKAFDEYTKNVNKLVYGEGNPTEIEDSELEAEIDGDKVLFPSDCDIRWEFIENNTQSTYIWLENTSENITFSFGEAMNIKVNFVPGTVPSEFKFYVNGEEVKAQLTENGLLAVEAEVNASELDKEITITAMHKSGFGISLKTSAVAVARNQWVSNNATDNESLMKKNLMRAIYKYNEAVEAFLASVEAE